MEPFTIVYTLTVRVSGHAENRASAEEKARPILEATIAGLRGEPGGIQPRHFEARFERPS